MTYRVPGSSFKLRTIDACEKVLDFLFHIIDVGEDVESPVVITKARRPDALAIGLLPIFQPELRS